MCNNIMKDSLTMGQIKDKYYTPEISEFHVGFKYERKEESGKLDTRKINYKLEWIKEIFTIEELLTYSFEPEENYFKIHLEQEMFRVKYLDKEDIESLGFRNIISTDTFVKEINKDKASIDFQDWEYVVIYNFEDNKVFEGSIKNKSELKKLLKQLNVKE